jgi:hypothetical protein
MVGGMIITGYFSIAFEFLMKGYMGAIRLDRNVNVI